MILPPNDWSEIEHTAETLDVYVSDGLEELTPNDIVCVASYVCGQRKPHYPVPALLPCDPEPDEPCRFKVNGTVVCPYCYHVTV